MKQYFLMLLCVSFLLNSGCREAQETVDPVLAPVITNLSIQPEAVCVGSGAQISFVVSDPNGDRITWNAKMNTAEHGNLEKTTGTESNGTAVLIRFKAATGGIHRHRVTMKIDANDQGGTKAESKELSFFVFSSC